MGCVIGCACMCPPHCKTTPKPPPNNLAPNHLRNPHQPYQPNQTTQVGRERPRRVLHLWGGRSGGFPQAARPRPHLPGAPGRGDIFINIHIYIHIFTYNIMYMFTDTQTNQKNRWWRTATSSSRGGSSSPSSQRCVLFFRADPACPDPVLLSLLPLLACLLFGNKKLTHRPPLTHPTPQKTQPNYCGEFDNAGAMMSVDETLMCSFQILKPAEKKQRYAYAGLGGAGVLGRPSTPPKSAALNGKK